MVVLVLLLAVVVAAPAQATFVLRRAEDMTGISHVIRQVAPNGFLITPLDNGSIYLEPRGHVLRIDAFMDNRDVHFFPGDIFRFAPYGDFTVWWDEKVQNPNHHQAPAMPRSGYMDPPLSNGQDSYARQTPGQGYYSAESWNGGYTRPSAPQSVLTERYFARIPEAAWHEVIIVEPQNFANFGTCATYGNVMTVHNQRGRIFFTVPAFVSYVACEGKVAYPGQRFYADIGQTLSVTLPPTPETVPAPARRR